MPRKDLPGAAFAGWRARGAHHRPRGFQGRALIHAWAAKRWDLSFRAKETGVCPGRLAGVRACPPLALACQPAGLTRAGPPSNDEPVCGTSRTRWSGEPRARTPGGGGEGNGAVAMGTGAGQLGLLGRPRYYIRSWVGALQRGRWRRPGLCLEKLRLHPCLCLCLRREWGSSSGPTGGPQAGGRGN